MSAITGAVKNLLKKTRYEGIGSDQLSKEVKTKEKTAEAADVIFHGETTPLLANTNYVSYNSEYIKP